MSFLPVCSPLLAGNELAYAGVMRGLCSGIERKVDCINKNDYKFVMNSKEFKRWLAEQGATFGTMKGSHLKVYCNGRQSTLPMHNADLKKGMVEAIKKQLGLK